MSYVVWRWNLQEYAPGYLENWINDICEHEGCSLIAVHGSDFIFVSDITITQHIEIADGEELKILQSIKLKEENILHKDRYKKHKYQPDENNDCNVCGADWSADVHED